MIRLKYKIGLEIHTQLTESKTKLFCDCDSDYRKYEPNTNVCPICLGLPGALPVPRRNPLKLALAVADSFDCQIPEYMVFTRKHYFYPDLPKNYQITQYEKAGGIPVCLKGILKFFDPDKLIWKSVTLRRMNIEEDPGKTEYSEGNILLSEFAYLDYNRSGVPLLEIVTEPEIETPKDARKAVEYLLLTMEYIGAINPRLEGSFRVDANISVEGGERVEVKNIGSTLDLEKALKYEIFRQSKIVEEGGKIRRETRHWDSIRGVTKPLRSKETEEEYLYFPDPDIPAILTKPLLVEAKSKEFYTPERIMNKITMYGVTQKIAWSLITVKPSAELFLESVRIGADPRITARILAVDYKGLMKKSGKNIHDKNNWPKKEVLKEISSLIRNKVYTYDEIKYNILPKLLENNEIINISLPEKIEPSNLIITVLNEEKKAVEDFISGKKEALDYLVGQVLKKAKGKAIDPKLIRKIIEINIKKS
ncbi:glutamyl-tRNA(Gln) and/or aspartyl-tRNA(Asn) amidotransferase, B subunit [Caldisphaera lagunensis DSM 15908]|uniref:Aspartyl/glutamyl-tRNA(Asn/Gln) amidotransferase subunit B n=1 Tax=Caldisphaera lagunensis (strain DSM 15908 / JCM 11604 / ANMR 0165 / IC-154) TaxID=1056495 RepID=L0ABL5_CALLD|nr:Asp-tRNA(Asn)/Glu-tRNA(Gln) amidotransferase subunit GatB [Caldisphaera lagunensis]AFZ71256.1 glutamyl-tRNA(Gln) and/or aspartyl-tRNA(Asn) amidotransferase, B subunit [Caldisphaera lagunensis DSM 15908]